MMHAQVQDISIDMERVTDVLQLKSVVRAHLNAVDDHLKTYRDTEENRHRAAEHEVLTLRARMKDLEREVNNLRERIALAHSEAIKDPLTGIFNRQAYTERLSQEYARWKRYQAPLTLVIWDIDNFKYVNDTYGHQAGDMVLRHVAKLVHSALRETDFFARYGGEDFVALMPETMLERALEPTEKIRALVSTQPIKYAGREIPVTLSAGIAQFEDGDFPDHVFRRADVALYKAKMSGKNRVCVESRAQQEKID
jgi:diguanylate cyclase